MYTLPEEMTNVMLNKHISQIEAYILKVQQEIESPKNIRNRGIWFARRRLILIRYAAAIQEAAYRKLVTLH